MKVLLFFIVLYFVNSFQIEIGYLVRTIVDAGDDEKRLEMVSQYMTDHLKDYDNIEVKFNKYIYADTPEELIKTLESVTIPNISFYYTTCTPEVMNTTIDEYLTEKGIFIWCLNTYNIGRCSRNFIMGNSMINNLETRINYNFLKF